MINQYEEAKKIFYEYGCSIYGMKIDGVYDEYKKYTMRYLGRRVINEN